MNATKKRQTNLPIEVNRLVGSPNWLLIFKTDEETQPKAITGTLDTVYEQFTALSEQYPAFAFAVLYAPDGRIHRKWANDKPLL